MNLRIYLITLITPVLLLIASIGAAQVNDSTSTAFKQTIKGTVTDRNSRLTLPGVTIKISSLQPVKSTATNTNGTFHITGIPVGRQVVEFTYTGYQVATVSEVLVTSGKETELNIEMVPLSKQLNEVVVSASSNKRPLNSMAMASGRSFSPEETNRYAGAFFDPARMAQSFAGVVAGGDNNEIIVRGNSPKSLQWRLEGVEIINPNHFSTQGASGGSVSMINSTVLSTSDFYTGAVPAEYNNATSGVFDLKYRKGNTDKREYSFTAGILGLGATLEGPFKKGGSASYLISYRYSTLDLLKKLGVAISDAGVPRYQDLSFNFVFPTKKAGTFSIFGIGGAGSLNSDAKLDYTQWDERTDADNAKLKYNAGSFGLKHVYIANNKLYFNNIISYSRDYNTTTVDSLNKTYQASLIQNNRYNNSAIRYAGTVNYRLDHANTIRAGLNAGFLSYNLYDQEYQRDVNGLVELLNQKGNAATYDAYIENKHDFGNVSLNTGVHTNYFNLSKSWTIEPRAGLDWQVTPDQQLSFAAGLYNRLEPLSYYYAKDEGSAAVTSNKLEPTKSAQVVMGYEKIFSGRLKFKTEVYYQYLYDVPVSSDPSNNFSLLNVPDASAIADADYTALVNKGSGKNYGLELSLEKSLSKGYYFMLTSSLFNSKFKAISGEEFNTTFDTRYVGNLVAGKEWAAGRDKKNLFGLNGKIIYAGGRRYSPINFSESLKLDKQVIYQSQINTLTADPYIRVDFSASYRINSKKVAHYLLLDIQNLLNRENNIGLYYNPSKQDIELNKWIGIIPTITYRIEL